MCRKLSGRRPAGNDSGFRSTLSTTCSGRLMRVITVRMGEGMGTLFPLRCRDQWAGSCRFARKAVISPCVGLRTSVTYSR